MTTIQSQNFQEQKKKKNYEHPPYLDPVLHCRTGPNIWFHAINFNHIILYVKIKDRVQTFQKSFTVHQASNQKILLLDCSLDIIQRSNYWLAPVFALR